jgi:hypothetical protein
MHGVAKVQGGNAHRSARVKRQRERGQRTNASSPKISQGRLHYKGNAELFTKKSTGLLCLNFRSWHLFLLDLTREDFSHDTKRKKMRVDEGKKP